MGDACDHLIIWLNTFEGLEGDHHTAEDLSDGIAMAEVLTHIAPDWFDSDWLSKLQHDVTPDNHRLKLSNLKKVLKGMSDYYNEVLYQSLYNYTMPDVNKIAESGDKIEMERMLQLVLGCAINCEEKEHYVQAIMSLEENVQLSVMNSIQQLWQTRENSRLSESSLKEELPQDTVDSSKVQTKEKRVVDDRTQQRLHEVGEQVRLLKEEKATLLQENERLLLANTAPDNQDKGSSANKQISLLQFNIDKLKEENFSLETAKEDFKIRFEDKEKKNRELQEKLEHLSEVADEARSLKDEVDVMRHTQDKVARYEATIEAYKKKLEEMSGLRQHMKTLEEKNEIYMQQTISLEEDSKKANSLKAQVESYKVQIQELHGKLLILEKRCDKQEFDAQRAKDKLHGAEAENERLRQERDMLKETNEELHLNQNTANLMNFGEGPTNFNELSIQEPFEMKEKLIRLEHENKVLTLQLQDAENDKTQVLQSNLDLSKERVNLLETENRQLCQEILELKSEIEDLQKKDASENEKVNSEEQKKLLQHQNALKESNMELQKKKMQIGGLETQCSANEAEIAALRNQVQRKQREMDEKEEKYKKYFEKAKTVIQTLDPKVANVDSQIHEDLRNRLQEKEKIIEHLERDHERMKTTKEREEKLMISAWYELNMQLHRKVADERQAGSVGLSFLSKQRQAASIRRTSLSASPRNNKIT